MSDATKYRYGAKGFHDGRRNEWKPPHDRGVIGEILFPYKRDEIENRQSYREHWREGRKSKNDR
jgi:hypothetical protein